MDTMPFVSVVVPTFNATSLVRRALDSALSQTLDRLQVIVVDDASDDGTPDLVAQAYPHEPRLRVVRQAANGGLAAARNVGLRAARGTWVAPLDADDLWRPDRLEALLHLGDEADAVFDNLIGFDLDLGRETGPLFEAFPAPGLSVPALVAATQPDTPFDFGHLKPILRRSFLGEHGLAYDEALRVGEDVTLYLRLLASGARTRTTSPAYYVYTTAVGAVSQKPSSQTNSRPRDAELREAFARILDDYRGRPDAAAVTAISERMAYLERVGPLASFYHARLRGDWGAMVSLLLQKASVRNDVGRKLMKRIAR